MRRHRASRVERLLAWAIAWPSRGERVAIASGRVSGVVRGRSETSVALPLSVVTGLGATNVLMVALALVVGIDRR